MTTPDRFYQVPEASDYIVTFYLRNRDLLLETAMCRTFSMTKQRKELQMEMIGVLSDEYGIEGDMVKIKYHFDNRKVRVMKRGHELKQKQNQGKSIDASDVFKNEADRRLWEYLTKTKDPEEYPCTQRLQEVMKDADMQTVKEEKETPAWESLLRNNGVVLGNKEVPTLNSLKWDTYNTKLVLTNEASDYVVKFFLDNQSVLLENTNSRSNTNNLERKQKMNELVTGIQQNFDIVTDAHKMKSHFDNRKSRVMRKAFDFKNLVRKGKSKTVEELFDSEIDLRLWRHYKDGPVKEKNPAPEALPSPFTKEIKVEVPEIIEGEELNLDHLLGGNGESEPSPSYNTEPPSNLYRKRRYPDEEDGHPFQGGRYISDDDFRAKQYELMEKHIQFMEDNQKLVAAMTSAVSILFSKIEALNVPNLQKQ